MTASVNFFSKKAFICFFWVVVVSSVNLELVRAEGRTSTNDTELESLFSELLRSQNALTADKITLQIWEIWTNDAYLESSRYAMEQGIKLMNQGRLSAAEKLFSILILQCFFWYFFIKKNPFRN